MAYVTELIGNNDGKRTTTGQEAADAADRLGDAVTDLTFETGTVRYPALSPAAFWREHATNSVVVATFLADAEDRAALRNDVLEAIDPVFDPDANVVELAYLRTTATVE